MESTACQEVLPITSPRKLQEMSLPSPEGHDVTVASGVSLKQYEEQLNGFRKENFHLKLRIYFLEEKLGSGAPPAVQGLLEHNVRLQVEVEELRRQLSDKQELLAAAAEAIDVLEQQGSISADSIDASVNNSVAVKNVAQSQEKVGQVDDTCAESESAGDYLAVTVNNEDMDELIKLRNENRKYLVTIKECMKKLQQRDREIKQFKLDKESDNAHVGDSQLQKYEEILNCKDEHIRDLENKIRDLQKNMNNAQNDESSGNLQQLLTRRLQGLAYFLDKLLAHKCVLGEDKKKLAENILEQSLALPVGLQLDETIAPEEITMDESNMDISQTLRIEDLTMMFGHHINCNEDSIQLSKNKRHPPADLMSESECWSEPDRKVSLARLGLCDTGVANVETNTENNRHRARRSRVSYCSRSDDHKDSNETLLLEEINQLTKRVAAVQIENNELKRKLELSDDVIHSLKLEKEELDNALQLIHTDYIESNSKIDSSNGPFSLQESRLRETKKTLLLDNFLEQEDYLKTRSNIVSHQNALVLLKSRTQLQNINSDGQRTDERAMIEETKRLQKCILDLQNENSDLTKRLESSDIIINNLNTKTEEQDKVLTNVQTNLEESNKKIELLQNELLALKSRNKDLERQMAESLQTNERLRCERQELENTFLETERTLRRAADEATVQASQAALERARAQHERLRIERELDELHDKHEAVIDENTKLKIEITQRIAAEQNNKVAIINDGSHSEEDRPTSPDQGIDSDRLSSLEHNDDIRSPRSLYEENRTLKQKLARTKATLAETVTLLNADNTRKRNVQRAICREIHKTHGILRKARDKFEG